MSKQNKNMIPSSRLYAMLVIFMLCSVALIARAVNLQVMETDFLQGQGKARFLREVKIASTRGVITDRNGEPLAVSTPVDSIWVHPGQVLEYPENIKPLAGLLNANAEEIERKLTQRSGKEFVWLRRRLNPDVAEDIRALNIPGVYLQKEYRRFYPAGEVTSHVIGFTNIDDVGQEGLELAYDSWLAGSPGSKRVIKDRKGQTVEEVELIKESDPGNDLNLTIDKRLQYLAYRELKSTVLQHGARSGSVVVLDVDTGEVLAMVNQPSYNPNDPGHDTDGMRNRAVTDVIEPGSVMKPIAIVSVLENGIAVPETPVETAPGYTVISGHTIRDHRNYGLLDVTGVLTHSSNVGVTQLALQLEPEQMWDTYKRFGFGEATGTGFPGESAGVLRNHRRWRRLEQATISYGYGISATPLQVAQAYAAIANGGRLRQPAFIQGSSNPPISAIDPDIANAVAKMLETVTTTQGTGSRARVANYRIAGKTGTSHKASASGYAAARYVSSFAGFGPASNPRLVCVVVINDPTGDEYYGGLVAAPLFSEVMTGAMRILNIPPDDYPSMLVAAGDSNSEVGN
ncbi:MAG: penicillin-binding transpeptidase domain-containing protein [Xanthomonadales bacterium]|nr:penicillin-binding transpeptidase domain-containing protein [Xanthomonadales bacterium]